MNDTTPAFPRADGLRRTPPIFLVGMLLMIPALNMIGSWTAHAFSPGPMTYFFLSSVIAQATVGLLLSGICGRSWIEGLGLGSVWCAASIMAYNVALHSGPSWIELFARNKVELMGMPMQLLVAASPIYFCRWLWGWRLVRESSPRYAPTQLSLESLFLLTAVIASVLFAARTALMEQQVLSAVKANLAYRIFIGFILSLFLVIPLIRWGIGSASLLGTALKSGLIALIVLLCLFFIGFPRMGFGIAIISLSTAVVMCSLVTIGFRADGFQLARYAKSIDQVTLPSHAIEETSEAVGLSATKRFQWTPDRAWTLAFVLWSICTTLPLL